VCFRPPYRIISWYKDVTANRYWTPSLGAYTAINYTEVGGSLPSGAPGCSVNWYTQYPLPSVHTTGHTYRWGVCISDGGCEACTGYYQFTY
jgi:hypothetical protein